jgi:hypothetical protein
LRKFGEDGELPWSIAPHGRRDRVIAEARLSEKRLSTPFCNTASEYFFSGSSHESSQFSAESWLGGFTGALAVKGADALKAESPAMAFSSGVRRCICWQVRAGDTNP